MVLYDSPDATSTITGRNLAHARRTAVERALAAADLHVGRLSLVEPTVIQAAALARVSVGYAHAAIAIVNDAKARAAVIRGRIPLLVASWSGSESLANHFLRSSRQERAALSETVGLDAIWDECVVPNI